jgi:hypothetical protein
VGSTHPATDWLDFYQKPATGGNWWLNWQAVDCPVGEQGIQWQVQSDSGYYFKVVPIYARIVVHTMCVLATKVGEVNSTWVQMDRYDNGETEPHTTHTTTQHIRCSYQHLTLPLEQATSTLPRAARTSLWGRPR